VRRNWPLAQAVLADDVRFRSPQHQCNSIDEMYQVCWPTGEGLVGVRFLKRVYSGDEAFVILEWTGEDGGTFAGAEYLRVVDGKIAEILVVNNDPQLKTLLA
jgi:hypothetical protein